MRIALIVLAIICALATVAVAGVEEINVGGRFMWDAGAWSNVGDNLELLFGDFQNATETRTARVELTGKIYSQLAFVLSWDFATGDDYQLKHTYLELMDVPVAGNVRAGYFFEPLGLEAQTSSKYTTFLETALPAALAPGRNAGIMVHKGFMDGRGVWQAGFFMETDGMAAREGNDDYSLTGRLAFAPIGEPGDNMFVHVGVSGSYRRPGDVVRFRARPENHLSDYLADTGEIDNADNVTLLGVEAVGVYGPFHCSAEFTRAGIAMCDECGAEPTRFMLEDDASFWGYYLEASYMITGEQRAFAKGNWGRTSPRTTFLEDGLGALEAAIRVSSIDLNDEAAGVCGGQLDDVTLGLNWYLHSNARLMLNYVMSTLKDEDDEIGNADALVMRMQFDF